MCVIHQVLIDFLTGGQPQKHCLMRWLLMWRQVLADPNTTELCGTYHQSSSSPWGHDLLAVSLTAGETAYSYSTTTPSHLTVHIISQSLFQLSQCVPSGTKLQQPQRQGDAEWRHYQVGDVL